MATAKSKTVEAEVEAMTQEPGTVAEAPAPEPYVPKFLRRPPAAPLSEDVLTMQRHGFITIKVGKTRDALGEQSIPIYTMGGLRYVYRDVSMAVPISVMEELERTEVLGVRQVPNPVFQREFASIEEVPAFIPKHITEETHEKRFNVQRSAPKDHEIGLALLNFPFEGAELKGYDPAAYAKYAAAWPLELERIRKAKAEKSAGAFSRI